MNLVKSQDYFNPIDVKSRCHIIGCGSVGSTVAELLARLGITNISLYDFDTVSAHNIANQMFFNGDIGRQKVDAVRDLICNINPEAASTVELHTEGWTDKTRLNGYVFLCVDNIDLRRKIAQKNRPNQAVKAMFDFRTRLEDAQHYAAAWNNAKDVDNFIKGMDFSHDEAHEQTPVTACNIEMGIAPTVRCICDIGVANFMNYIRTNQLHTVVLVNPFSFEIEKY